MKRATVKGQNKIANPDVSNVEKIIGILSGILPDDYDKKSLRMEKLDNLYIDKSGKLS